jgi:alkylated DNA repair dioxygenase AlkB
MTTQPFLIDVDATDDNSRLVTPRHINYDISGAIGLQDVPGVPGLMVFEEFLTPEEQTNCIQRVDAAESEWRNDLRRRVQHYGWRYDYKARAITPDMHIGALPDWLDRLAQKLYDETGLFDRKPEQVIVNEYQPGQGIATHIDHRGFGPTVCTISLLDDWEMDFSENWDKKMPALLKRGSCVLLANSSRSKWQHGIAPRKTENVGNGRRDRKRRLSLTFRTVLNRDGINDG